MTCTSSEIKYW